MPKTGRSLIGIVAGFKSEWWPVFDRNAGRLHVGIRISKAFDGDIVMIDRSSVRVHQHAAAGKRGIKTMAARDVPAAA